MKNQNKQNNQNNQNGKAKNCGNKNCVKNTKNEGENHSYSHGGNND